MLQSEPRSQGKAEKIIRHIMTPAENEILALLEELQHAVASMPTANPKPDLRPIFAKLDELTNALPKGTDPQLLHFLHRKSYEKAQDWLQARR